MAEDYYSYSDNISIHHGLKSIYQAIMENLYNSHSCAIQDDYSLWSSKRGAANSGKLLLIDPTDQRVQQIFFDDNISSDTKCSIVDIRNITTGKEIQYKNAIDKYMIQVEPNLAILDDDYFIKKLDICEKKLTDELNENVYQIACKRKACFYIEAFYKLHKHKDSLRKSSMENKDKIIICLINNEKLTDTEEHNTIMLDSLENREQKISS